MANQLAKEHSPYLLQHKDNPVNWYPWGREAFEAARTEDKPIFLSIGYSTCHWCHVMAHESFEDELVARVLNRDYIAIKVDREERPDVDGVYMAACTAMTGSGGWPLTVLLTPEQKPFWAGTYLPKRQLLSLLAQSTRLWLQDREQLLAAGDALTALLQREGSGRLAKPSRKLADTAAAQLERLWDRQYGGFGTAPKFPTPHNLLFLLRYSRETGETRWANMAFHTLECMYRGGIFDHVAGGFSRYSTDRQWLVPHFEKMLYDNALLAYTYAEAFQTDRRPLWERILRRTLDYALQELQHPQGGFFSAQDADSDGEEGKYYLFTPLEIHTALGERNGALFCAWYGITDKGNMDGKSIPNRLHALTEETEPHELESIRQRLRNYRVQRTSLHRDEKILTAWNGLMIAALAKAGLALDEPVYIQAAQSAVEFLCGNLMDENHRLLARWRDGHGAIPGKLEDYAFLAWGLLELYAVTFKPEYLAECCHMASTLLEQFFQKEQGGFFPYAGDDEALIARRREVYDGAMPSGNSVCALVLSRLARLTGETHWRNAAERQLEYLAGATAEQPAAHCFAMLAVQEALSPTAELVCCCRELPAALTEFLRSQPRPELTVLAKTPDSEALLSALAPFTSAYPIPETGVRYYLCRGGVCSQPVDALSKLTW